MCVKAGFSSISFSAWVWLIFLAVATTNTQAANTQAANTQAATDGITSTDEQHRTPIAGKSFHTDFAGEKMTMPAQDRRSVTAWDGGIAITPQLSKNEFLPIGSLYVWRRPSDRHFLRATIAGLFDDVFYSYSPKNAGPLQYVATFENFTVPFDQAEFIDGNRIEQEELTWGYVRFGAGLGVQDQIGPYQDNIRSASLTLEPGYYFFSRGNSVANDFVTPESNFETRLHARFRWDDLERNLIELAHQGYAFGADLVIAHRNEWEDWGRNGQEDGNGHQEYGFANAYVRTASGVPGLLHNERHRFLTSLYGGLGNNLDRFSAPRLGGAPQSDEFGALASPRIPGALVREFFPNHYAVAAGEYRYEATFFSYIGLRGSVSYLDRNRLRNNGQIERENDVLGSIGVRLTTGFLLDTRLQLEYNYNTAVVRDNDFGGHNVVLHISGGF